LATARDGAIIKNIAIVPTALVTAISSFIAFQDYHGEITRAAKAESDLSKLITEMEIEFLQISTKGGPPPFNVERDKLARWWTRADGIIKGVDDEWLSRFDKIKPVK